MTESQRFQAYIESFRTNIRAYGPGYAWWWVLDAKEANEGFCDFISGEEWKIAWESVWNEPNVFKGTAKEWETAGYHS